MFQIVVCMMLCSSPTAALQLMYRAASREYRIKINDIKNVLHTMRNLAYKSRYAEIWNACNIELLLKCVIYSSYKDSAVRAWQLE